MAGSEFSPGAGQKLFVCRASPEPRRFWPELRLVPAWRLRTPENSTIETDSVAGHIGFELQCAK
jgi:hypothetical protein